MISEKQLAQEIQIIIENAIREDVGDGDHSSLACIPKEATGKAKLLVKDEGILAGVNFAQQVFNYVDPSLEIENLMKDGDAMTHGDIAFYVSGSSQSILKAERLVLNAMQRMSAIATKANLFSSLLKDYKTQILDTRKTTPGFRALEKMAVKIGGGENHRFALYDMIMLKDNHIDFAGGISKAIEKTIRYLADKKLDLKIVVEARSLSEVEEILQSDGVYRILLDNFSYDDTKKAVKLIGGRCFTESSGGITLENAKYYAECGVDYISSGALIHSVHNLDLSLKAI
ncbi:carboxylating nicotinate-nucleotide diphosphorylase [Psychroflexus lacisalsi]|jgi:nicotinate-nucleotide pyrophosphorylase (carboxylating)|uniref:nicotinate-nucleotide diphosphorylase (carboxylating) n=1 Tax=Psychroflexus lacisalsi TaxID=503928 RepID=A0ABP3VJY8_9FLAO|nr:carboxylating nicotinate-nucleotide diphosphorylase [Psychroflexus lacisalsi]MBZ9619462.1 carboxylating nicotinate-nucleotide diphosphorylase [Psychroflexus lacisalsi]